MLGEAIVTKVTPTTAGPKTNQREIDLVLVAWEGMTYGWETARGTYSVGDTVPIITPEHPAYSIRPA